MGDSATCTITVFTRHAPDCPKKDDRYWKRCKCRKTLYVYENGHDSILSARTRAWEQAERLAKAERELASALLARAMRRAVWKAKWATSAATTGSLCRRPALLPS